MSAIAVKNAPTLEDVLMAADTVDTIRHEMAIQETEMLSDDRRAALKARLRQWYESQGTVVSDEIIERAVDDMDKNRYVHEPLAPGLPRLFARMWINRGKIALRTVTAIASIGFLYGSAVFIHSEFVVKPRERAEIAAKAEQERIAAELKLDVETRLPQALKSAHTAAVTAATEYKDDVAKAHADNLRDATLQFLEAKRVADARKNIDALNEMASSLKAKAEIATLISTFETTKSETLKMSMDEGAKRSLTPLFGKAEAAARKGDVVAFNAAKRSLDEQINRIQSPLMLRIVDRAGVRSGVWRTPDNNRTKVYYLIVEALDVNGVAVPFPIKNFETGNTETVTHWGIRVPEATYNKVGHDKQSDGVIDDFEVGKKPAGTLEFKWSIPQQNNQMITRW
ncbi:DUF6384 family protein [Mesorhizobium sp. SP-1A]|uniref:DUF6384 family protein n=1 Tax=Mesorhizobium sp. SP-1A TaxID=3077840 RepID=UPI0028F718F8|nr:DUF6384 family protein [Mesorhizobium sp. SP-1A]